MHLRLTRPQGAHAPDSATVASKGHMHLTDATMTSKAIVMC
jgi:hypothetical protein